MAEPNAATEHTFEDVVRSMLNMLKKLSSHRYLLNILLCFLLSSCSEIQMIDSSADPAYSQVIGRRIKVKKDLLALGISSTNKPPADYIDLVPEPGYSGPEVVSRRTLKKDTVLQVIRVLTSKSLIIKRTEYVVREVHTSQFSGEEVRIALIGNKNDAFLGLDGDSFEVIDEPEKMDGM